MGIFDRLFGGSSVSAADQQLRNASFGVDGQESRNFQSISSLNRTDAMRKFPDFDVAYLRAAYPTGNSGDHASANISIIDQGLPRCVRKSLLLGRLSAYWTWKGDPPKAFCYAVHCLSATQGIEHTPGDVVGCINLLAEVFRACGQSTTSALLKRMNPGYDESPDMQQRIAKIAAKLTSKRYQETIAWGNNLISSKFSK